ncbi:glycerate kinase type-2 family protein [Caldimonas tepidiphila]|uniref:glycerate kinase type-2 family protein n=1 Tax=Caldimonas tepidiphila TaxID=2315841 RepID=UPI000E5ABFD2|nr:glycerate kinase [Caldimonas tepidiphila]
MSALPYPAADPAGFLRGLFAVAVAAAQPARVLGPHLPPPPPGRTLVLGGGKASGAMAQALERAWPQDAPLSGLVVTRYGHVPPAPQGRIRIVEAAHPVPDAAGEQAAREMLALARGLTERDLVICLISGGGSALLTLPAPGLGLADLQDVNRQLLKSGASIGEMNVVRKHLSALKGGRLGAACAPARVLTLLVSDVPGDDPAVIASGPTVPDASTCDEALAIVHRHGIVLPPAALQGLASGAFESPKPDDPRFAGHEVRLVATPQQSLQAAADAARLAGVAAHVLADDIEGESREVGRMHAALARQVARRGQPFARPCVLLSGGETTVTVRGPAGRGGRAGEFLLGMALALDSERGVHALAADTDGIDGMESNAGATIAPDTLARATSLDLSARLHLDGHDAWSFFHGLGDLVVTGPTYTNVNDFRALLVL